MCKTKFAAKGRGVSVLGMGNYELKGQGVMRCRTVNLFKPVPLTEETHVLEVKNLEDLKNLNHYLETIENNPVEIKMNVNMDFVASPFQIGCTLGRVDLLGYSNGWTLTKNVQELLGDYKIGGAHGTFGIGLGSFVAARVGKKSLAFQMSLQVARGFGGSFGFSTLKMSLDEEKTI